MPSDRQIEMARDYGERHGLPGTVAAQMRRPAGLPDPDVCFGRAAVIAAILAGEVIVSPGEGFYGCVLCGLPQGERCGSCEAEARQPDIEFLPRVGPSQ